MRSMYALLVVVSLISIAGCQTGSSSSAAAFLISVSDYQSRSDKTDKQILKSLNEINKNLASINAQLKGKKIDLKNEPSAKNKANPSKKGPDLKRLKKIKLPKDPSRAQVKKYIEEIIAATKDQNVYSSNDPQVDMLREISAENIDLLLEYAEYIYVQYALPNVDKSKKKKK